MSHSMAVLTEIAPPRVRAFFTQPGREFHFSLK